MIIKSLKINNFSLFKEESISFDKLSIITGINLDVQDKTSNGSGKSTIINAILFALFGDVSGLNQKDLLRFGEKECSLELECSVNNEHYKIVRKIPTELKVYLNNEEVKHNTATLAERYIEEHICSKEFFKQFRMIDVHAGLNVLDYGNVALKKTLMNFLENMFLQIRVKLLNKKNEREILNISKKPYHYYLSEKRLNYLESAYEELSHSGKEFAQGYDEAKTIVGNIQSEIKTKQYIIDKNKDTAPKQKVCPYCKSILTAQITEEITKKSNDEIEQLSLEIEHLKAQLEEEQISVDYLTKSQTELSERRNKIYQLIVKLKEAFKFKDYKYTAKDVAIYTEAIKLLDSFAGVYINEWLKSLEVIINHLLAKVNLSVEFSAEKDFLKVYDGKQTLKYEQLSAGQKTFLSAIFKIAILLHKGLTGLIIADEGLGNLDCINLKNLVEIIKDLPLQVIIIYQNIPEIQDVNIIKIERKDGESKII